MSLSLAETPKSAHVMLRADDYGNAMPMKRGINEMVAKGLITDISAMITFVGQEDKDELLSAIAQSPLNATPGIGLSLHANFVTGKALTRPEFIPTLVTPDGKFRRSPAQTNSAWQEFVKTVHRDHAQRELDAQIERFYQVFGHYPHSLDTYNVNLCMPPWDELAMQVAQDLKISIGTPLIYCEDRGKGPFSAMDIDHKLWQEYRTRGIATPDNAVADFSNNRETLDGSVQYLLSLFANLKPGRTQFVFHPGHPNLVAKSTDPRFERARVRDFLTLTDPRVVAKLGEIPFPATQN